MPIGVPISTASAGQHQAAHDRIEQAAGRAGRRRHLGEDRERQAAEAFPQQHAEDQHQPAEAEQRGGERQHHGDGVAAAAARRRATVVGHGVTRSARSMRISM